MPNAIKLILNYAMTHIIRMHSNDVEPFFLLKKSAPTTTSVCFYVLFRILIYLSAIKAENMVEHVEACSISKNAF